MIRCRQCGARNRQGREKCWHCGGSLLNIKKLIEHEDRQRNGFTGCVCGALIGWFIFPLIFVLFSYHQFSLMELIRLTIKVMFAGATFGAFSGYLVATRLKH